MGIELWFAGVEIGNHQFGGVDGLRAADRDHCRDALPHVAHLVAGQGRLEQMVGDARDLGVVREVEGVGGEHTEHPRGSTGLVEIDADEAGGGERRPHEHEVGGVGRPDLGPEPDRAGETVDLVAHRGPSRALSQLTRGASGSIRRRARASS